MSTAPTRPPKRWAYLLAGLLALLAAGSAWWWWRRQPPPAPPAQLPPADAARVLELNNHGIGLMEQYKYPEAAERFAEVVRLDPRWLPGAINLGIARLNQDKPETLAEAVALFEGVLQKDPNNPYAHFGLGIILRYQGTELGRAAEHFEAVTRLDANDPHAWYFLGLTRLSEQKVDAARECFEKALDRNPYLLGAMNNLQLLLRRQPDQRARADALLERFQRLQAAEWGTAADVRYGEMGRYAQAIGRHTQFGARVGPLPVFRRQDDLKVELAGGARWAGPGDFGRGAEAELLRAVRARFGGVMVVLDYDRDGKPDLLLLAAVVQDGHLRDLLLHNEGGGHFRDVTEKAGLGGAHAGLGCAVADFDNDGFADVLVTTAAGPRLFRNRGGRGFEDVTKAAGLDAIKDVCLGAVWVDIDQDGDLDLVLARTAARPADAAAALKTPPEKGPGPLLLLNVGEAPPAAGKEPPPLRPKFRPAALPPLDVCAVNVLAGDLDADGDMDLLVFPAAGRPRAILNDRLLKFHLQEFEFHPQERALGGPATATWNGALVLDSRDDERGDLFVVGPGRNPLLWLQMGSAGRDRFYPGMTNSPRLLQAQAVDIDLDGRTDVVGLSDKRRPVLLHNDAQRLVHVRQGLGADADWPADVAALVVTDADGDGFPDFFLWSEAGGLRLYRGQANGNHGLALQLTGRREKGEAMRTNADAIGTRVAAQAAIVRAHAELATVQAGLGQSSLPLLLGLGKAAAADFVSLRWPDGVWQAELSVPAGPPVGIRETNRKSVSCPLLFAWGGTRFGFVTDFLGAGSVGEPVPGGGHRPPRPHESVKIEPGQLAARDGRYLLKFAEPMDEVTYLDRLQLVVVDHPAGMEVYPDERFVADPRGPSQDLLAYEKARRVFPVAARDHRGRDLTQTLRHRDRITADDFARRAWTGFAEEHAVELDFGDRLAGFDLREPLFLFLAGWTDYALPESIWAAAQAGVQMEAPSLERLDGHGRWQTVLAELGFPAGLPRMMATDVTGLLTGPTCRLRIRTNMHVFWDQVFVAPLRERRAADGPGDHGGSVRVTRLEVQQARLEVRGCVQEFSPDGREPTLYDDERLAPVAVTRLSGRLTRPGDVTELLQQRDDRYVTFGAGDEVTVTFDATGLPPLPRGWTRSYVLRSWGYCKDAGPFTAAGGTIEPLPFAAMSNYPYGPGEHYPDTPRHAEYLRLYQTRQVGPRR
jgi:cytochrome c-type biogenesis protein CcmH/NrfG